MRLFDLHCDTLTVAMKAGKQLAENDLQLSFQKGGADAPWLQTMAVFVPDELRGQVARDYFDRAVRYLRQQLLLNPQVSFCRGPGAMQRVAEDGKTGVILSVEGGAVLAGRLDALRELAAAGVRMITLTWNGANELGGGAAEPAPLTAFGKQAVREMERLHIAVDVSHASDPLFDSVCEVAQRPFIATHSNSRAVCPHRRNLTDAQFSEIVRRNGLVGLNLYPAFVTGGKDASFEDIYRHIDHFLALGGETVLAIGTDFDGAFMPSVLPDRAALGKLYEELLRRNLKEACVDNLFFGNAYKFFRNL